MFEKLIVAVLLLAAVVANAKDQPAKKTFDPAEKINDPRPDARKIAFTVDEATWSSVDISPDNTTLLFDLLGDLYTLPIAGGKATVLAKGPAFDYQPRYSPDGKTIAFVSDRSGIENVWLMDADGKNARALTEEKGSYVRSPSWSPDGNYIVARKEDARRGGIPPVELWIYHVRGGSGVKLTGSDDFNNGAGAIFSKDGRYIYFAARSSRFSYTPDISHGLWSIQRYDRRTGETTQLTSGIGGAARPGLSPDGKTLTFVSRRDADSVLVARNLATGGERVLARGVTRDEQEGFAQMDTWPAYSFSPDGSAIYFSNHGKLTRLDVAAGTMQNIPFTADVDQSVAPRVAWRERVETGPVRARILRWPVQSPDRSAVIFDAFGRIWIQRLNGSVAAGSPQRLTADDAKAPRREYAPAISPDGQWLSYVTWSDAEGGHIWRARMPKDGATATPERLTSVAGHYINPEFSPNGDRIVFIQGSGLEFRGRQPEEENFFDVKWMPVSGGAGEFVTSVKIADTFRFHPQAWWSADGTRVYVREYISPKSSKDDPKNELVSVRLDGTDRKRLLRFPAIGDLVPSPDEQWVAFTSRDNVYVTALPNIVMKDPPEVGLKEGSIPVWRLSEEAGGYVEWADAGKTITWTLGNTFHRLPLAAALKFVDDQRKKADVKEAKEGNDKSQSDKEKKKEDAEDEKKLKVPPSEKIAITLTQPRATPSGSYVMRHARVITMKGDEVLENADVAVRDNRITAVGANLAAPAGAKEFDASGKTIIPGLIDTHAHLHYSGLEIFPDTKWEYVANLAYGVTTVYDPSAPSLDVFAQAEMVESGHLTGPRVYSSGDVLYGGAQTDVFAEVNSLEDARRQVRRMKAYGARMIKVYQQPGRAQRLWFAEACRLEHMLLTAEGAGELHSDLTMAADGFTAFEHSLPVELQKDAVQFVAKTGTYYTPTLIVSYGGPWGEQYLWQTMVPHEMTKLLRFTPHFVIDEKARRHLWIDPSEYHFPEVAHGVAEIVHAGGNASLGAHGQVQGFGPHWELWAMAGEGAPKGKTALTPHEALRASTLSAADKIGFAPDLGSIEAGKLADFVVLDANPLDDIHNTLKIRYVVKNGDVFEGETLTKEWPSKETLPRFFWSE